MTRSNRSNRTQNSSLAPVLPRNLSANLSAEHQARVARIVQRTGVLNYPRLSQASRELFVIGALVADADGASTTDAVRAALSDPAVLAVARRLIAEAVSR